LRRRPLRSPNQRPNTSPEGLDTWVPIRVGPRFSSRKVTFTCVRSVSSVGVHARVNTSTVQFAHPWPYPSPLGLTNQRVLSHLPPCESALHGRTLFLRERKCFSLAPTVLMYLYAGSSFSWSGFFGWPASCLRVSTHWFFANHASSDNQALRPRDPTSDGALSPDRILSKPNSDARQRVKAPRPSLRAKLSTSRSCSCINSQLQPDGQKRSMTARRITPTRVQ